MRLLAVAVIVFVVGFALGGWMPRTQQYALEERIGELEAQLKDKAYNGNPSLSGITRMLNVPEPAREPPPPALEPTEPAAPVEQDAAPAAAPESRDPRSFREHIEQAAELWGVRSDLARQAFLDQIAASEEQALRFDLLMEAMNVRLEAAITEWAAVLAEDSIPPREAGIRMMKDITEALVITYDELDRGMPPRWKRDAGESFQIIDYIDPVVALPLADLEGRLNFE